MLPPSPNWFSPRTADVAPDRRFWAMACRHTALVFHLEARSAQAGAPGTAARPGNLACALRLPHTVRIGACAFATAAPPEPAPQAAPATVLFATGSSDGQLILWTVPNGAIVTRQTIHPKVGRCSVP